VNLHAQISLSFIDMLTEQKPQCRLPRLCFDGPDRQIAAAVALKSDRRLKIDVSGSMLH